MSLTTLMDEIGDDADLLTRNDAWLDHERKTIAERMNRDAQELRAVLTAQRIKRYLQQRNLVAVQQILKGCDGEIKDIVINLLPLPDAMMLLNSNSDNNNNIDQMNRDAQLYGWHQDGYDLATSTILR